MQTHKFNQNHNLTAVAVKSYWVALWDRAANTYSSRIVNAANAEQAQIEAVRKINVENEIGPDEDGGFLAVGAYESTELMAFAAEVESNGGGNTLAPLTSAEPTSHAVPQPTETLLDLLTETAEEDEDARDEESDCSSEFFHFYLVTAAREAHFGWYGRIDTELFIVRAKNLRFACRKAVHYHMAEAFREECGHWITCNKPLSNQTWICFKRHDFGEGQRYVLFWIDLVDQLPPEDAVILKKYLTVVDD